MQQSSGRVERVFFLDNLRLFAVLAVVALHAGIAYAPVVPWWYVTDNTKSAVFDLLLVVTDGFVMPTLFFIAGYFALRSLRRDGVAGFLIAKVKRLGLPLVVVTVFFCPIISYVAYLNGGGTEVYLDYWLRILPTAGDWSFRYIASTEDVSTLHNRLWAFHLWFLAMLLFFCGLLALGHAVLGRRTAGNRVSRDGAGFGLFLLLALAVGLAEALGQALIVDGVWASFGPLFVFQPSRVPLYLGGFLLGVYAWDRSWFTVHRIPGRMWLWTVATIVAFAAMAASGMAVMAPEPKLFLTSAAHGLARTLFALTVTGLLAVFGQRYWNRPGGVSASLSAASYDIYLAHFPLVVVLQYLLAKVAVSAFVKFGIVFLGAVVLCWGTSHLVGYRRKVWVPAGVAAAFGACVLAWG